MGHKVKASEAIWNRASIIQRLVEDNDPRDSLRGAVMPTTETVWQNLDSIDKQCDRIKELVTIAMRDAYSELSGL
jgi:hypothetical protein